MGPRWPRSSMSCANCERHRRCRWCSSPTSIPSMCTDLKTSCAMRWKPGRTDFLILDLPAEERRRMPSYCRQRLQPIRLIAPTTPPAPAWPRSWPGAEVLSTTSPSEGVTGEQKDISDTIGEQVAAIRRHTPLPIACGFLEFPHPSKPLQWHGNRTRCRRGSAIVRRIARAWLGGRAGERIKDFVTPLVQAAHTRKLLRDRYAVEIHQEERSGQ